MQNKTMVIYFLLKGISEVPELQFLISLLVLLIYIITIGGNMTILLLVIFDSHLHTPMYFFLCYLSILNIFTPTVALHRILVIFVTRNHVVSFTDCIAQVFAFAWFCGNEMILLTAMSYDRYVAICSPLHYSSLMNSRVCIGLATFSWSIGLLEILPLMVIVLQFSCYSSNIINHFLCDILNLKNITCSDTSILELEIFALGALSIFIPFLLTFSSYVHIIATILRIQTSTGRSKVFYTCSNELVLLTAMSYDRYVAICIPLNYSSVMNSRVCVGLATFSWSSGLLEFLPILIIISQFSCYTSNAINHFLCDIMILKNITCNDTSILELEIFTLATLSFLIPFLLTFFSYVHIIATIMRIKSSSGRSKAFYTCSSHLTVVVLLYTSLVCQYLTPSGTFKSTKLLSLLNTAIVPMLNPFIYSLKNNDVKTALQRKIKYFKSMS